MIADGERTVLLLWRVKAEGRHAPARVLEGEVHVDASKCLDMARSLYETRGCSAVAVLARAGEWWVWRAEGPVFARV